ncbi:SHOCT domain-containing protein [Intrasporangium sp.]|uniref:SHOCT domain-containing protein n=1 Tax=Intrasporangium sp. TaxID=1925024 RepID=UPI002D7880D5|nr:SHOCT domain-containing protein [Intrasporangium sp.]
MMWWNDGFGWGNWVVMTLAMVAFWGLVVFAVVALFRDGQRTDDTAPRRADSPEEILDERFARGEIDAEEYHARKEELHSLP